MVLNDPNKNPPPCMSGSFSLLNLSGKGSNVVEISKAFPSSPLFLYFPLRPMTPVGIQVVNEVRKRALGCRATGHRLPFFSFPLFLSSFFGHDSRAGHREGSGGARRSVLRDPVRGPPASSLFSPFFFSFHVHGNPDALERSERGPRL